MKDLGGYGAGEVWLDLSRLPWRAWKGRLTGIDRVELAYARHLLDVAGDRLRFVAFNYRMGFRELPRKQTERLVRGLGAAWEKGDGLPSASLARSVFLAGISPFSPQLPKASRARHRPVYINVSTHPLCQEGAIARFLARTGAAFVPLMHDMIPSEHPEYVPPSWTKRHLRRMTTIANHADGVIANSQATADAMRGYLPEGTPVAPLLLGVEPRPPATDAASPFPCGRPYFVMLGTIEPRKNHLTLLHAWRAMATRLGRERCPGLLIVGARGWDNEQVVDILDRCVALRGIVVEAGRLPDGEVTAALEGARALVMPSFIEGFGLPVAEALASGCPVICSDIPAHREVGAQAPEYIDPVDAPAWVSMIERFAEPRSAARAAALLRTRAWRPVQWADHVTSAVAFADEIAVRSDAEAYRPQGIRRGHRPVVGGLSMAGPRLALAR